MCPKMQWWKRRPWSEDKAVLQESLIRVYTFIAQTCLSEYWRMLWIITLLINTNHQSRSVHTALDLTSATFFFFFWAPSSTPFGADFLFFSNSFFFFLLSSYSAIKSGQSRLLSGSQVFSELKNTRTIHLFGLNYGFTAQSNTVMKSVASHATSIHTVPGQASQTVSQY